MKVCARIRRTRPPLNALRANSHLPRDISEPRVECIAPPNEHAIVDVGLHVRPAGR